MSPALHHRYDEEGGVQNQVNPEQSLFLRIEGTEIPGNQPDQRRPTQHEKENVGNYSPPVTTGHRPRVKDPLFAARQEILLRVRRGLLHIPTLSSQPTNLVSTACESH